MASEEYKRGFVDGWTQQYFYRGDVSKLPAKYQRYFVEDWGEPPQYMIEEAGRAGFLKPKRKRRQSPKQKLLTEMTQKKWKSYKRNTPKGKKTYVQIRAQVSRSQAYKKKAKKLR
jgi:hypothetical protein